VRVRNLRARDILLLFLCVFAGIPRAVAHVGSKDVFEELNAGAYKLMVTVRMPTVIPGVATVEVRSTGADIGEMRIAPLPVTGEASLHPPTPDRMVRSKDDPNFFTGNIWMMAPGAWQVRFTISGADGEQTVAVPVPAVAISMLKMKRGLGALLIFLGLFLVTSMSGIVAAAVREADLKPGIPASPARKRKALIVAAGAFVVLGCIVWSGLRWWGLEEAGYMEGIFRPLVVQPVLHGNVLDLNVTSYTPKNRYRARSNNDFLLDHNHLMHLYMIREPEMDAVYHLHPVLAGAGDFRLSLPAMPAGEYKLYGDVVHANGFPETLLASITVPAGMAGSAPGFDDAEASVPPLSAGMLGNSYPLPDGYTMVWNKPQILKASTAYVFHFELLDAKGNAAGDVVPYMGMAGHAAFVKTDGTVFAHTHPEGSASMAALMLVNGDTMGSMPMDMPMPSEPLSNIVEFPYGFPTPGRYRIFVQMKHGATIETGTFDALVN
jgi:hypothetical protein